MPWYETYNVVVIGRVFETIRRHAMFHAGQRAGVAVSGGPDSVCLLHVLAELAPRLGVTLTVLHLNHKLRGEQSEADARFVCTAAASLGIPALVREEDVRARGGNLEQAGREARYSWFRGFIASGDLDCVATGHTRPDQAETVLYRLIRGAGTAGLAGILPVTEGIVRPLLDCDRPEIGEWLKKRGIPWREDPTNLDKSLIRNKIRSELLPYLQLINPGISATLAHTATLAREDEDYWRDQVEDAAGRLLRVERDAVVVNAQDLVNLPTALARRLIRYAMQRVKGGLRGVDFEHIDSVLRLAGRRTGQGRVRTPLLDIVRSFEWVRLARPSGPAPAFEMPLSAPGEAALPLGRVRLEAIEISGMNDSPAVPGGYNGVSILDADRLSGPLTVRSWRPGDRIVRAPGAVEKLKVLFHKARIPVWDRQEWPVIASGDRIIWARRFGVAADLIPTAATRKVLEVSEILDQRDSEPAERESEAER
ncbi:MAG: tRNA lysidine(34) synthetase TilS [Acidobacteria bacterium]|nr:tRNA lysidine(34) synthetase TilS [Acidobacteriota bacterium]